MYPRASVTISPTLPQDPPRVRAWAALRRDLQEMIQELIQYRELLVMMTRRDLLLRYKQTIMGFGWSILMPVTYMIVFSLIFTRVVKLETGVPYPIYAYAGLLPWNFFASSLRFAVSSLTANPTLVTKVYFPREILPFSVILVSLVDFAVGAVVLAGLMIYYHVGVHAAVLFLPVVLLVQFLFTGAVNVLLVSLVDFAVGAVVLVGLMIYYHVGVHAAVLFLPVVLLVQILFTGGVTLILAMGNLFYRDVKYLIEIVITLWMFATSVVYPVSKIGGWTGAALKLNPMTTIIDAYRSVLLHGQLPAPGPFAGAAVVSAALLLMSWLAFHRAEYKFAESI